MLRLSTKKCLPVPPFLDHPGEASIKTRAKINGIRLVLKLVEFQRKDYLVKKCRAMSMVKGKFAKGCYYFSNPDLGFLGIAL